MDQAVRLQELVEDIIHCCQDRLLHESKTFGLPTAELKCLLLFKDERYLTAKSIAQKMDVGKSRVTKIVDGLIAKGLLERIDDPRDGRVKLLSLTRAGRDKMDQIDSFALGAHRKVLQQLDLSQRITVLSTLELLRSAMLVVKEDLNIRT